MNKFITLAATATIAATAGAVAGSTSASTPAVKIQRVTVVQARDRLADGGWGEIEYRFSANGVKSVGDVSQAFASTTFKADETCAKKLFDDAEKAVSK